MAGLLQSQAKGLPTLVSSFEELEHPQRDGANARVEILATLLLGPCKLIPTLNETACR